MEKEIILSDGSKVVKFIDNLNNQLNRYIAVVEKNGKKNLAAVIAALDDDYARGKNLLEKDYDDINRERVRTEYNSLKYDIRSNLLYYTQIPRIDGYACRENGKSVELYYFPKTDTSLDKQLVKLFSEADEVESFKQVYDNQYDFGENLFYLLKHLDGTFSLVYKDFKNADRIKYLISHSLKVVQSEDRFYYISGDIGSQALNEIRVNTMKTKVHLDDATQIVMHDLRNIKVYGKPNGDSAYISYKYNALSEKSTYKKYRRTRNPLWLTSDPENSSKQNAEPANE